MPFKTDGGSTARIPLLMKFNLIKYLFVLLLRKSRKTGLNWSLDNLYWAVFNEFFSQGDRLGIYTDRDQRSIFWVLNFENLYFLGTVFL